MAISIETTSHPDVMLVTPARFEDGRGAFSETWNARAFAEAGIAAGFCQDNQSWSARPGTIRGLHYQAPPFAQSKLVRVLAGEIVDVAVDVRRDSPRFGQWVSVRLSAASGQQVFVPKGFLHGFATLQPDTVVFYKVDNFYDEASSGSVSWDDRELAIDWELDGREPVLSERDRHGVSWADFRSPF